MQDANKTKAQLIDELVELRRSIASPEFAENIVATVREPLVVLDAGMRVLSASRSFYQNFKVSVEETRGQVLYDLGNKQWDIPRLRELLEQILPRDNVFNDFEIEHDFETIGQRTMLLNARRIDREAEETQMVLLAIEDITERKKVEDSLRESRRRLEVSNNNLAVANEELETFAYSVSHDLRAPLRGIDGFSKALLDDYQDKLDATAKDYINRVRAGTRRMATLIDDLLRLSHMTRAEMRHQNLDLGELGRKIVAELRRDEPDRGVDLEISSGLAARGDRALLEAALDNLLRNAWKFTGNCAHARIELGMIEQSGERVYFVRDNGAGFDMTYVDKLFGAFQRLHHSTEFSGTGIGLAIVHRVILRHGGRIWAEGEVGKGATFYFTLPTTRGDAGEGAES